jgi:hypothetical protein
MQEVVDDTKGFKKDMAKFYDVKPTETKDIRLNEILIVKDK